MDDNGCSTRSTLRTVRIYGAREATSSDEARHFDAVASEADEDLLLPVVVIVFGRVGGRDEGVESVVSRHGHILIY